MSRACREAATGPVCEESTALATSDVVTNALVRGRGRTAVGIETRPPLVRGRSVTTTCAAPQATPDDKLPTVAETDESGRALCARPRRHVVVGGVMDRADGGKDVWFEVTVHP